MTATTEAAEATEPVRVARWQGACPNCIFPISPGQLITKPRGRPWQHHKCQPAEPARRRRRQ